MRSRGTCSRRWRDAVMSPALKLLIDGVRIVMQVLVDEFGDRMTRDTREDIQQWYDRCYEMLGEGQHEQVSGRNGNDSRAHEFGLAAQSPLASHSQLSTRNTTAFTGDSHRCVSSDLMASKPPRSS